MDQWAPHSVIGHPAEAPDARAKVTGEAVYTYDIELPGMLHGKILRSPHPHARIRHIDISRARAISGVQAVVTGADLAGLDATYGCEVKDQPVLAIDKVRYVGDSVAAVAAVDEATAYRALEAIKVHYALLPPLMTMDDALAPGAPLLFEDLSPVQEMPMGEGAMARAEPAPNVLYEYRFETGDLAASAREADHVFEDVFTFSRMSHLCLEPYVAVARVEDGGIELWSCNQDPFPLRQEISRIWRLPEHRVRIHSSHIGGGFGGKSFCKIEPVAVLLSQRAGRPVRLCLTVDETILTLSQHAAVLRLRTGVRSDGTFVFRDSRVDVDGGAYADASPMLSVKLGYRIPGPYRWKALQSLVRCVRTTTVPAGSFRGFGGTQASWASESQVDMIARRLGLDPYEVRMRNLVRLGEPCRPGDSGIDSDLHDGLARVVERLGYLRRRRRRTNRGMGLGIGFKDAGGVGRTGQATVKVTCGGDIFVQSGTAEIGQGTIAAMSMIAAEVLRQPLSAVRFSPIDTDHTPLDQGTRGSCSLTVMGLAVQRAADDARHQILEAAAEQLGMVVEDLDLDGWSVRHGNARHDLAPLLRQAFGAFGFEFVGRGVFRVPPESGAMLQSRMLIWIPCWCGADVEVDPETGRITVHRLVVGVDAGKAINPAACRGQVEGAALQGLGQALFEQLVYNGEVLVTASPLTYRLPLATDLPGALESLVLEQGHGIGPFGAKGIGEGGILGVASAIANAVADATGARVTDLPLSPERVLAALGRASTTSGSAAAPVKGGRGE